MTTYTPASLARTIDRTREFDLAGVRLAYTTTTPAPRPTVRTPVPCCPGAARGRCKVGCSGRVTYGACTACGAIEVALHRQMGTRDLSAIGESATYPTGHGCELCD